MSRTTTSHVATVPTTSLLSSLSSPVSRRAALTALLLPLAACAADPGGADDPTAAENGAAEDGASGDGGSEDAATPDALTVTDPWVKAAEEGMTSGFGILVNGTDQELVLVGARTSASTHVELHETTGDGSGGMSMQEKEGGFPLPAGSELLLEPGGNHLMLMELTAPLQPGDEVEVTLEFGDGTELPFTATVKDFTGAQEHYEPEGSSGSGASDGGGEHDSHDGAHGGEE
ncbi:copper chaperone PCu(A)C [Brachybacterium sp.]|uniref:copper chaperone PCu(A)C n=1 Tax=Brachybacterium sp. TaxID=1891286 RepID=UPI002ED09C88